MTKFSDDFFEPTAHDEKVEAVLAQAYRANGNGSGIVATPLTLDDLAREEDAMDSVERFAHREAFSKLLDFYFAEGPDPAKVLRRVFCMAKAYRPDLVYNMSDAEMALLFGETRAAVSARRLRVVTSKLMEAGAAGTRTRVQKSAAGSATFSRAQRGNQNRKQKKAA